MSELTLCNFCSLQDMMVTAQQRKISVIVKVEPKGSEMEGCTSARYSNEDEPSRYWMKLPDHCVC